MLNKTITDLINSQINKEFYSSFLYLEISNFFIDKSLNGFGNWFSIQAQEEYAHAMLFLKYLQNNGEKVILKAIDTPTQNFTDFKQPLELTLEHEKEITASINSIYGEAYTIKDFKTMQFLDWFVKEQGEEEQKSDDLCKRYELFGTDARGLYLLDSELGTRTFSAPSLVI